MALTPRPLDQARAQGLNQFQGRVNLTSAEVTSTMNILLAGTPTEERAEREFGFRLGAKEAQRAACKEKLDSGVKDPVLHAVWKATRHDIRAILDIVEDLWPDAVYATPTIQFHETSKEKVSRALADPRAQRGTLSGFLMHNVFQTAAPVSYKGATEPEVKSGGRVEDDKPQPANQDEVSGKKQSKKKKAESEETTAA